MRHINVRLPSLTAVVIAVTTTFAAAQTPPTALRDVANGAESSSASRSARVEVWGAFVGIATAPGGDLVSVFSPPLLFGSEFTSRGGQTLAMEAGGGMGFQGGVNVFLSPNVGVQVLVDRASADVSGANDEYSVAMTYVSRPPNSAPVVVSTTQSVPWPGTTGSITQTSVGLNAVVRAGRTNQVNATMSGGFTVFRTSGTAAPVGFTAFRLGGHSVLFSDEYRVATTLGPATSIGFNAGAELNVPLGRGAAVLVGYRYFGTPSIEVAVTPNTVVNADQVVNEMPIADISQRLALAQGHVHGGASRLVIGVKLMR